MSLHNLLMAAINSFLNFESTLVGTFALSKCSLNCFFFSGFSSLDLSSTSVLLADRFFLEGGGTTTVVNS